MKLKLNSKVTYSKVIAANLQPISTKIENCQQKWRMAESPQVSSHKYMTFVHFDSAWLSTHIFSIERLLLLSICIDSSFQPSVQTNWRISGFESAKVGLFCWIFCHIQPNWIFDKIRLYSLFWTTKRKNIWSHFQKAIPKGF